MGKQTPLGFYGKGIHKTKDGHLRYSSPSHLRNRYVHRVVVEQLLEETPYSVRLMLPAPYQVHHMDYDKENNDPSNFLLLSESFHSALTSASIKYRRMVFRPKWRPQSVLFNDLAEEIPF